MAATQQDTPKPQQTIGVKRSAGKRASLSTPAAKRSRHSAPNVTIESPAEASPATSTPAAASPAPTSKLPRLPTKIHEYRQLPTQAERQDTRSLGSDYQSIEDSAVLSEALHRSKLRWINEGILDRYWVKPETGKHAKPPPPNNPEVKWMKSKGPCRIRVEPHVFEVDVYIEEKVKPQPPPKQYATPAASQSPYRQPYRTQPSNQQHVPQRQMQHATPPLSRAGTPGASHANRPTPPGQQRQNLIPLQHQRAPIASAPPADMKPSQDPVITMLAARASSDAELKGLMKEVATGNATPEQLKIFQRHIDELTAIIQKQRRDEDARQKAIYRPHANGGPQSKPATPVRPQNPPPGPVQTPVSRPQSLQQTPVQQAAALSSAPTPSQAAMPQAVAPTIGQQPGSIAAGQVAPQPQPAPHGQALLQPQAAPQITPLPQQRVQSISGTPANQQPPSQLPQQPLQHVPTPARLQQQQPKSQPATPYNYSTPQQPRPPPQKPWVPPPPASLPVIIAFTTTGATEDRFLFPQHSVLEALTPQHMLASFIVTKKSRPLSTSADDSTSEESPSEIEYWQPLTIMVEVAYGREEILNCIRRWVKPVEEVCKHMEATMARCTRAPTEHLALRLPFRSNPVALSVEEEDALNAAAIKNAAPRADEKVKKERRVSTKPAKKKDPAAAAAATAGATAIGASATPTAASATGGVEVKPAPTTTAVAPAEPAATVVAEAAPNDKTPAPNPTIATPASAAPTTVPAAASETAAPPPPPSEKSAETMQEPISTTAPAKVAPAAVENPTPNPEDVTMTKS